MTADLFKTTAINVANENADKLSKEFLIWLPDNLHIWNAFVDQTMRIIRRGYAHYSSYTIVEFLRHHSALEEKASEWKINNNVRPYLPRLFDLVYPQHVGLWEYRLTTKPTGKKD
jgi:hypothetical protein